MVWFARAQALAQATSARAGAVARLARTALMRGAALAAAMLAAPAIVQAAGLTVAWNANAESNITSYGVLYRTASGATQRITVPSSMTSVRVDNLTAGARYYVSVVAINTSGVESAPSGEVDGLAGEATVAPPAQPGAVQTYFAEGASGFFSYRVALMNTTAAPATVVVTYLREGGSPVYRSYSLPSGSRSTALGSDVAQLANTSFAAVVSAVPGVIAERTMRWRLNGADGATGAKALSTPATQWFLAEGNAGYFQTYVLLANPGSTATNATVDFLLDGGGVVRRVYTVNANQRFTIWTNQIPELNTRSFATTVRSDLPILVERAMYFSGAHGVYEGGHGSAAVRTGARNWFLAEGSTGSLFEMFVLISNPNAWAVTATIQYLTPAGLARTETRTLAANSRTTIPVDSLPGLGSTDVSCSISGTDNIIVERSMYWPGVPGPWHGGHNSVGTTTLGTRWGLAEGEVGGVDGAQTFVLLANPGAAAASVTLTYYREGAAAFNVSRTVAARSRVTVSASEVGLANEKFGVVVTSTQPIAVERSIYWNYLGAMWTSGTNETATPLP
jgi:Fibronectin type III domain